jgi:hypothetical protein
MMAMESRSRAAPAMSRMMAAPQMMDSFTADLCSIEDKSESLSAHMDFAPKMMERSMKKMAKGKAAPMQRSMKRNASYDEEEDDCFDS